MRRVHGLLLGMLLLLSTRADADSFDDARKALPVTIGRWDASGMSLHGGAGSSYGGGRTVTIFRGQVQSSGGCGSFDLFGDVKDLFENIPDIMSTAGQAILNNMPELVLCSASPILCDLYKDAKALVATMLQMKYARCQAIQHAMNYIGTRLRGGDESNCLEYQANLGIPIQKAMDNCVARRGVPFLRGLDGGQVQQKNLVEESLRYVGASTEVQQLAKSLVGEVVLTTQAGRYGADHQQPVLGLLAAYEANHASARDAVQQALDELRDTGDIADLTLQRLSVPGQVVPRPVLDGLLLLRNDPVRGPALSEKVATGIAITQLKWQCDEISEQLAAAAANNPNMTPAERDVLEQKRQQFDRELQKVIAKKKIVDEHYAPAMEAVLQEYARAQAAAASSGVQAASPQVPVLPYGRQIPAGYSR